MDTVVSQRVKENWIYKRYQYRCDRCNADGSTSWRRVRCNYVSRNKQLTDGSSVQVTSHTYAPDNAKNWRWSMTTGRTIILDDCDVIADQLQPVQLLCGTCDHAIADGLPRTNNSVQGWHHVFQSSVSSHHPNIYKLNIFRLNRTIQNS